MEDDFVKVGDSEVETGVHTANRTVCSMRVVFRGSEKRVPLVLGTLTWLTKNNGQGCLRQRPTFH